MRRVLLFLVLCVGATVPLCASRHFAGGGSGAGALYSINARSTNVEVTANTPFTWSGWFRTSDTTLTEHDLYRWDCPDTNGTTCGGIVQREIFMVTIVNENVQFLGQDSNNVQKSCVITTNVADGSWHEVSFTRDSSTVTGYLDGVQGCQVGGLSGAIHEANGNTCVVYLGQYHACDSLAAGFFFVGDLAEISFYNAWKLTTQEIGALAKGTPANKVEAQHLTAYWPLYGATGGDSSGQTPESESNFAGSPLDTFVVTTCAVGCEFAPIPANHCPCDKPGSLTGR